MIILPDLLVEGHWISSRSNSCGRRFSTIKKKYDVQKAESLSQAKSHCAFRSMSDCKYASYSQLNSESKSNLNFDNHIDIK